MSTEDQKEGKGLKHGDIFTLNIEEARAALSSNENISSIFLTKPWKENELKVEKELFLTAWLSESLGDRINEGKEKLL